MGTGTVEVEQRNVDEVVRKAVEEYNDLWTKWINETFNADYSFEFEKNEKHHEPQYKET